MSTRQQRRVRERRAQQRGPSRGGGGTPRGPGGGRGSGRSRGRGSGGGLSIWTIILGIVVILLVAGAIALAATNKGSSATSATPTLAPEDLATTVDGVHCNSGEMLSYHIHQHLLIYDQGKNIQIPSSIGIPGTEAASTCLYWIHVHQLYPNIIHVESPTSKIWRLGNFFAIWKATKADAIPQSANKALTDLEAAPASDITVFYNGKRWTKGYQTVPLTSHAVIQVDIGKPVVPPKPFTNWGTL